LCGEAPPQSLHLSGSDAEELLFRYFTRLSLQSFGMIRSSCEVLNASGHAAFLSTLMEKGRRRCSALIDFLKNRFAAETSRLALSMNSIV
jgi:hypothetical protein